MQAIRIRRTGGPEVLEHVTVPTPTPGPAEVLVRARAIGVNMPEVLLRRGEYPWSPPLPVIPGMEMAGVVEAVGSKVSDLAPGQPVYVSARELEQRAGCYAEYIAVNSNAVYRLAHDIDLESAATLSGYQAAWHLLHSATSGYAFDSVMVTAAAGGVGSACVQLARAEGKRVIAVAGSEEKAAFAKRQGADVAIDHRREDVGRRLAEETGGRGVDLVLDAVAGERFPQVFDYVAALGLVILYGSLGGWPNAAAVFDAMRQRMGRSPGLRLFSMHTFDDDPGARRRCTEALLDMLAAGAIRPHIHDRFPLAEAARAHALLESGQVLGKLLLKP